MRVPRGLAVLVLAASALPVLPVSAAGAATGVGAATAAPATEVKGLRPMTLTARGQVRVADLPAASASAAAARSGVLPRHSKYQATTTAPTTGPRTAQTGGTAAQTASSPQTVTSPPATAFPMVDLQQEYAFEGFRVAPPDTMMAVGPTQVVEMVNVVMAVYDKAGNLQNSGNLIDLAGFFGVTDPTVNISDPRVTYDPLTQRWFAAVIGYTTDTSGNFTNGEVFLAVSQTSDPLGTWTQYTAEAETNVLLDQEKLGVSSDKVTLAFDQYDSTGSFNGAELEVLNKSELVAGLPANQLHGAITTVQPGWFSVAPAQELTTSSTEYATYNDADVNFRTTPSPTVGLLTITGVPTAGTPTPGLTERFLNVTATDVPPPTPQPGTTATIDSGDDRFTNAVWRSGLLWTFGNDKCTPAGDTTARSCARLIQLNTNGTPSVRQNFDVSALGQYFSYPAVSFTGNGDSAAVFSEGSATTLMSVVAGGQLLADPLNALSNLTTVQAGTAVYNLASTNCFGAGNNPGRWGDYSAAAPDPSDNTHVWVAGAYAATSADTHTADCDWGTAAGKIGFDAPTVTGISPTSGPSGGGTTVVITGTGFTSGATVKFGGVTAQATLNSSTQMTASSPNVCASTTDVTVTTPYGTSAVVPADRFTFTGGSVVTSVAPSSGFIEGGTAVVLRGTCFNLATAVRFGGVSAGFTVDSPTQITATSPAHAAGRVDVTVDIPGVAGVPVGTDVFTYVPRSGYWMVDRTGHVYAFGDSKYYGALNGSRNSVVDIEPTRTGNGYWLLDSGGEVFAYGDAANLGQPLGQLKLNETAASMSADPNGNGYWVFTDQGRAFSFGGAPFEGDMTGKALNGPVLGSVATPDGKGYYMVASDGGIFAFGTAHFYGSKGGQPLNGPVVGLAPDPDNVGYWLVATDGGIFAYQAPFKGSKGGQPLNKPVVGMVAYGDGYLMVASDGGIFDYSSKPFLGSLGNNPPADPVVNVAPLSQ